MRASAVLALFSFVAKLTGLWRDRILAGQFGASSDLDVYYSAFKIPDLVFNLLVLGAVSSAIIPVFIEWYQRDREQAWRMIQNVLNVVFVAVIVVSIAAFIFAGPLGYLVAPGFGSAQHALLVQLLRIMLLSPIIFSISSILGAILQARERFIAYAIAPVFYNIGIIAGAWWLVPYFGSHGYPQVYGLAFGVVLGVLGHLAVQLPSALAAGFRFARVLNFKDTGLMRIVRLTIPRTLSLGVYTIGLVIVNALASLLGAGSITIWNIATNLQFLPVSIFGISLATAAFPRLSSDVSSGEKERFHHTLYETLLRTTLIVGVSAIVILLLREPIVRILFQTGTFNESDAHATATVVGIFMLGVVAQSLMYVLTRAYYALQDTRTPFYIALFGIGLQVGLSLFFTFALHWDVRGLALATAIAYNLHYTVLYLAFRKKYL